MDIREVIKDYGLTRLARELGLRPQAVSNWRSRGVPAEYCPANERATQGRVRCEDVRPDVDWSVLRHDCAAQETDTQEVA